MLASVAAATLAASPILTGQARVDRGTTITWTPPRTTWGDPDIQGTFTNKDEFNTPLERPAEFAGRTLQDFSPAELARLNEARQQQHRKVAPGIGGAETGAGPTHWFESFTAVKAAHGSSWIHPTARFPR